MFLRSRASLAARANLNGVKALLKPGVRGAIAAIAPLTWSRRESALVVLMYHRVLPRDSPALRTEQPAMFVSPATLDMHLSVIKRHFELVHLDRWLNSARQGGRLPRLACAITFDDGWRDNFEFALPVLRVHAAPATIFLVSNYIGTAARFWPNRLIDLLHRSFSGPRPVEFPRPLVSIVTPVLEDARQRGELSARDTDRVVEEAKVFGEAAVREMVCAAEQGCGEASFSRELLNGEEIAKMAETGLVRFGSHTATHLRFHESVPSQELEREISLSQRQLREICGQEVRVFCYPNGETSPAAIALVRQHYWGAVTTRKGWHGPQRDPYLIRRIGISENQSDSPAAFLARLSAWF